MKILLRNEYFRQRLCTMRVAVLQAFITCLFAGGSYAHNVSAAYPNIGNEASVAVEVSGTVTDETGATLPGVNILEKGTTNGTTTDANGKYRISVNENAVLIFSFIGFNTEEREVGTQSTIDVMLTPSVSALSEIVVVGYGTQKKIDVTGSVARVDLETMANAPNTNIGQFLQGTVPGLNVGLSTFSGGTPPISIRGQVTLNGSQNVLIIVDGIQFTGSLSSINPDDIASIDVLKDASATAVYGAQAANGVILITTRKGRSGQTRVAFSSAYTTSKPTVDMRPLNREQYLEAMRDGFWRDAFVGPDYTTPNSSFDLAQVVDATMALPDRSALLPNDFDWWEESTNTGSIFENTLSIAGGGDKFNYLLSGGMVDQKGLIINDNFERKSVRANLETNPFGFWKIGLQSSGSFVNQDGSEPNLGQINITSPLLVPFDANGELIPNPTNTVVPNPFLTYYVTDRDRNQYFIANIYSDMDIPFIKGLNYRMNFGNNFRTTQHYFASKYGANLTGQAYKDNQEYYDYTFDNILTYTKSFGRHEITLTGLYGAIERMFSRTYAEGTGFSRLNLTYNDLNSANNKIINPTNLAPFAWTEALNYQMGRINYKFNDRYLLTATVRRDGFSGFAENYKYAVFPSVGLGWIISSENFMRSVTPVNSLKLRATYGTIGNQTQRYSSLARVSTNSSYVFGDGGGTAFGQQVTTLNNPNLKWERTQGLDIGIDFTLLQNRLTGTLDYYSNNTYDLLYDVTIPTVTGFDNIRTNLGQIHNTGFEASLTYLIIDKGDFNWTATYNFWSNKNEIIGLKGVDADGDGREDDLVSDGLFIGKSINTIYDYEAGPIYQLNDTPPAGFYTGSLSVIDHTGEGTITPDDRVFLGREEPAYRMSLNNTISYKGFTLSFFLNSIQGGKDGYLAMNTPRYFRDDNAIRNNIMNNFDFWSPRNPDGKYPRVIDGSTPTTQPNLYQSRSFVRLQDISLGYALPQGILSKIKAQSVNVYVSAKNLATWTNWEGWDPETTVPIFNNALGRNEDQPNGLRTDGRPVFRAFTFGVHIVY